MLPLLGFLPWWESLATLMLLLIFTFEWRGGFSTKSELRWASTSRACQRGLLNSIRMNGFSLYRLQRPNLKWKNVDRSSLFNFSIFFYPVSVYIPAFIPAQCYTSYIMYHFLSSLLRNRNFVFGDKIRKPTVFWWFLGEKKLINSFKSA